MQKLSNWRYSDNGVTILFTFSSGKGYEVYTFSVEGDEEMTKKLRDSVKKKEVGFSSIHPCALALFEIIKDGEFPKYYTQDEIESLYDDFREINADNDPEFFVVMSESSTKTKPCFIATLQGVEGRFSGKGRTKDQARAVAVKDYLESVKQK